MAPDMELWDIYDREGHRTGRQIERWGKQEADEYHLTAEIWVVNRRGEILIQKRSATKDVLPGIWCLTTGCMQAGEDSRQGSVREIQEELGMPVNPQELQHLRRIVRPGVIWDLYLLRKEWKLEELRLQEEEVSEVRWVSPEVFRTMAQNGELYVYPELYDVLSQVEKILQER